MFLFKVSSLREDNSASVERVAYFLLLEMNVLTNASLINQLCELVFAERRNLGQRLIESSAEMGWQRDHNKEKAGGWENGSGKSVFTSKYRNDAIKIKKLVIIFSKYPFFFLEPQWLRMAESEAELVFGWCLNYQEFQFKAWEFRTKKAYLLL